MPKKGQDAWQNVEGRQQIAYKPANQRNRNNSRHSGWPFVLKKNFSF